MSVENKDVFGRFIQLRGGYSMVPNELWELTELDTYEKVLWAYIVSKKPDWNSSRNNLARNLGITREKVSSAIKKLERLNMLVVIRGQNKSWSFGLITPDKWSVKLPTSGLPGCPRPDGPTAHTKEYKNPKKRKNSFSQEGSVYPAPMGAEGDQSEGRNAYLPGKNGNLEDTPFISPEAEAIYHELVAQKRTPDQLNGMSLIEYANQRAYAASFRVVNTEELVKQWRQQQEAPQVEEYMKAAGVSDDDE